MVDCKDAGKGALRVFALIFAVLASMQVASALEGWNFSRDVTITNNLNQDLTNYQIKITLNTAELISKGKMRSDCGDILFTDSNGNLLNYWIRPETCNTSSTEIWVKVSSIPALGTVKITMWYGNPSATSLSNGEAVFEWFDDASTDKSSSYVLRDIYNAGLNANFSYDATNKRYTFSTVNDRAALTVADLVLSDAEIEIRFITPSSITGNYQFGAVVRYSSQGVYYLRTVNSNSPDRLSVVYEPNPPNADAEILKYTSFSGDVITTDSVYTFIARAYDDNLYCWISLEDKSISITHTELTSGEWGVFLAYASGSTVYFDLVKIRKYVELEPSVSIGEEKSEFILISAKNEKTGETLTNFAVSYYEIGESGEFLSRSSVENQNVVALAPGKHFVCVASDTFFERCKVVFKTDYTVEETFYLPPQADTIYTTVTVFDPTGFFYSIGSTVALYVKEGEILDERFIDASHKASLPLIIGKTYLVGVRNPQDSRIVGYISSAQYSITLYVNQLEFPQQHYAAVLFNCTQTESYIKCNWSTQAGNTSYATMEIYDVNGNLVAKYEAETPNGSFTFLQTGEIYRVVFKVINDIQSVEYSFASLNLTAIPTPTPVTPAYITPGVSIPSFDVKSVPAEYRMLFIGGLALVASMFFRRTHAPIGMAVSLAIIVASVVSGLLEINHNLIILLILILAISFFEIERTRGTVR